MGHDTYTHYSDGRVCIPVEDYWFVPLDAGGEGYTCNRSHGPVVQVLHMDHRVLGGPVCWRGERKGIEAKTSTNIDDINCVDCLRMLVKDAVLYGRDRRPKRKW